MITVPVKLKERSYNIDIGAGLLRSLPQKLPSFFPSRRFVIVTNTTLARLYRKKIDKLLSGKNFSYQWIVIPDGEKYKTLATVEKIIRQIIHFRGDRKTGLVALGGGVVGDVGGFVASIYMRGIPFIQIPTTLLAQVDSSVGGKTGVDLESGKNLVGAFYQPRWVLIDTDFLKTLPQREYLCGLAEVVKYGVIRDEKFFKFLESNISGILKLNSKVLGTIIRRSCAIKAHIVSQDEREGGLRVLLNFGHTLAHAIETLSGYSRIHHGEAVSMGMVYATGLSFMEGLCSEDVYFRLIRLLVALGLPTAWPDYPKKKYAQCIQLDKKSSGRRVQYIAVKKMGQAFDQDLAVDEIVKYI